MFVFQQEPLRLIRENHPERLKKLVVVAGDTTLDGLGISADDADTLKNNVSVIINMAANVRFDVPLRSAVTMNTKGTANVIALAKQVRGDLLYLPSFAKCKIVLILQTDFRWFTKIRYCDSVKFNRILFPKILYEKVAKE
jgi:hypothetical protein